MASQKQPYSPPLQSRATTDQACSIWSQIPPLSQHERPAFTFAPAPHLSQPTRPPGTARSSLDEGSNEEEEEEEKDNDSDESSKSAAMGKQAAPASREISRTESGLPTPKEKERSGAGTSKPDDLAHLRFGNLLAQSTSTTPIRGSIDFLVSSSTPRLLTPASREAATHSHRGGASNSPLTQLSTCSTSALSRAHSVPSESKHQLGHSQPGNSGQISSATFARQTQTRSPLPPSSIASRPGSKASLNHAGGARMNLAPVSRSYSAEQNGLPSLLGKRRHDSHEEGSRQSSVRSLVGSPSPNKRRRDPAGIAPILASMHDFADRTNEEIASLKSQLIETTKKHDAFRAAVKEHVKGVLERFEKAKRSMESAVVGMRTAFAEIRQETGGLISAQAMKDEVEAMRENLSPFISVDGQMMFEKQEDARVEALRELMSELTKQQGVIDLLRDQLTIKTGETYEARDRIASLEQASLTESAQINTRITTLLSEFEKAVALHDALETKLGVARERGAELVAEIEEAKRATGKWNRERVGLVASIDEAKLQIESLEKAQEIISQTNKDLLLTNDELMIKNQSLSQSILELTTTADQLKSMSKTSDSERARIKATNVELTAEIEREKGATEKAKKEKEKLLAELEDSKGKEASFKKKGTQAALRLDEAQALIQKMEVDRSALEESYHSTLEEAHSKIGVLEKEIKNQRGGTTTSNKELQSLRREKVSLETQLKKAQEERSSAELRSVEITAELESTRQDLEATSIKLAETEKESCEEVANLKQQITALKSQSTTFSTLTISHEAALEEITKLRTELATVQNSTSSISDEKEKIVAEAKKEALIAFRAAFEKDKADSANQIKRSGNRLAETEKKLQKALTELAIAKNRPMIDARIADSSPIYTDSSTTQSDGTSLVKNATTLSAIAVQVEESEAETIEVRASPDDSISLIVAKSTTTKFVAVTPATSITATRSNKRRKSVAFAGQGETSVSKSGECSEEIEESEDSVVVAKSTRKKKMQNKRK